MKINYFIGGYFNLEEVYKWDAILAGVSFGMYFDIYFNLMVKDKGMRFKINYSIGVYINLEEVYKCDATLISRSVIWDIFWISI